MDSDGEFSVQNEAQFWEELDDIVCTAYQSHERIDNSLRTWLAFTAEYRTEYVTTEEDVVRCSYTLVQSRLFETQQSYIRHQIVFALLQEDDPHTLHLLAVFLLADGRRNEESFDLLRAEGGFGRLVELIRSGTDDELGLHRHMLELLYEMSRKQCLSRDDLATVDDAFVGFLLEILESISNDVHDPYHYPLIRVLLVLNEQYMVSGHDTDADGSPPVTNRVVKSLSVHGNQYKTFGESIILLLNRETEISLQLLILKLLYLLFMTPATLEYFYTNDLHVLVDILLRNLLDLPVEGTAASNLRHTYLRVLHPLLAQTQLQNPPHYKPHAIRQVLFMLTNVSHAHFAPADETTVRLVGRCIEVPWLQMTGDDSALHSQATDSNPPLPSPPISSTTPTIHLTPIDSNDTDAEIPTTIPKRPPPRSTSLGLSAEGLSAHSPALGIGMSVANRSATSVVEIAAHREPPGVLAPSRTRDQQSSTDTPQHVNGSTAPVVAKSRKKLALPVPPPPRLKSRRLKAVEAAAPEKSPFLGDGDSDGDDSGDD